MCPSEPSQAKLEPGFAATSAHSVSDASRSSSSMIERGSAEACACRYAVRPSRERSVTRAAPRQAVLTGERRPSRLDRNDPDVPRVRRQTLEIVDVDRRNQASPGEIGHGDDEGIHGEDRGPARGAEELSGSHANSCIDRIHLHAFALEPGKHSGIFSSSSNDFCEDRGDGSYRQVASSHLRDEGSNTIAPLSWPARYRRKRFAIEKQH